MLQQHLAPYGYEVVVAQDGGDEGILMAVTESPDVLLIATDLPVIDGWQTIKILKSSTVTQKIPVIALIALTTDSEWSRISESGCDDYELKPIDLNSVLNKIKALLNSAGIPAIPATPLDSGSSPCQDYQSKPLKARDSQISQSLATVANTASQVTSDNTMVVYIDDSPIDSQAMADIVRGAGYCYNNITEPLEAIPLLLELKPKLIFLDLVMPFTNGYEICAQIRRTSTFRKTPIIIVTNNDGIVDRIRAKIVGASGLFSKPVKEQQVFKVLNKYLNSDHREKSKGIAQGRLLPFF